MKPLFIPWNKLLSLNMYIYACVKGMDPIVLCYEAMLSM